MDDTLIITIIEKFSTGSIAELDFQDETAHLILRKERAPVPSGDQSAETAPHVTGLPLTKPETGSAPQRPKGEIIVSPIVATFYASPGPDSPSFVSAGAKVKAGDTLCILEAMKMMNHLEAEYDCEILSIHAKSGDLVEYGQILFEVKRL